ncbi:hypothetical protein TEA_005396 [Camellia sinensis var. sinensis]|uniref:non-specific serine/threonine protein kinase n=1 Tax=Camellia sinensis var. sinensis TaxID=542762 RepID=A0A4S4DB12_CAMSN|nr:hypothetical protein TEA_005396 [Camellia sinensis var. sinensis]
MEKTWFHYLAAAAVVVSLAQYCFLPCLPMNVPNSTTDQSALLAFKAHITFDNPHHILANNWSSATSVCDWVGVSCGKRHRRVTALNLPDMGIGGTIPPHIGNLSFLSYFNIANNTFHVSIGNISTLECLDLRYNFLEGRVPQEIGYLPKLKKLIMGINNFSGSIPPTIFNISSLELINFSSNMLSGILPEDLCVFVPKLKFIHLSWNEIEGQIPSTLGECRELQLISLSLNKFSGFIPKAIGNLTLLQKIILGGNNFKGEIPRELGSLQSLEILAIEDATLTGVIPSSIFNISSLKELYLWTNKLTGNIPRTIGNCLIPEEIGELLDMKFLQLSFNNLMGVIPTSMFNISSLKMMSLVVNNLSGNLPSSIGLWLPNIYGIFLGGNRLTGIIPESISNASQLVSLGLSANAFTGPIPKSLGNLQLLDTLKLDGNILTSGPSSSSPELSFLTSLVNCRYLQRLHISSNPLDGILPTTIGNLFASLEAIYIDSCGIRGNIPSEIGNLSNLAFLNLAQNGFTGFIPSTIRQLGKLQRLYLFNNKLQGSIPNDLLCHLRNLGDLRLNQNELYGLIPECLGNITSLRYIYLDSNKLTSIIPTSLWSLKDLLEINLSSNSLNGYLPPQFGSLKVVTLVDFSMNQFTGKIPSTITSLQNLVKLSLAHNKLQGPIPDSFGSMVSLEFLDLSYNDLSDVIPKSLETLSHLSYFNVSFNRLSGQIPNGGPFANFTIQSFMSNEALCGAPKFQVPTCHTSSLHHLTGRLILALYICLPIVSILLAMSFVFLFITCRRGNKTPTNVDLLPAITPPRITYQQLFRATNRFSEGNLLGSGSFGSVYKAILEDTTIVAIKRLDIMIDVASALEYLHHDYSMPLVHCDLKPSNILLDDDMVAHVSDFGIAKFLDLGESVIHTKTIATFGYIAPEFGLEGLVSTSCDVYSYGILLMETFTRVKPIDEMFSEDMTIKRWMKESLPNAISQVIDANLLKPEEEYLKVVVLQCVSSIMELALSCSVESPNDRINMKDILATLKKIKLWYLANCGRS